MYANVGENCHIAEDATIGVKYKQNCEPVCIGDNTTLRSGAIVYADVTLGGHMTTGHRVLIREHTLIGHHIVLGTNSVIDGQVTIGDYVKIETGVYIPTHTKIGSYVFIGPNATFTNDKYPQRLRSEYVPQGPIIEDNVTIGANVTVLPGVRIGYGSMIAAGAVVTQDVPEWSLVLGVPGKIQMLPEKLREKNRALNW